MQSPPQVPSRPRKRRWIVLYCILALLGISVVAVSLTGVAKPHGTGDTVSAPSTAVATPAPSTAAATPARSTTAAAPAHGTPAAQSSSAAARVVAWEHGPAGAKLADLKTNLSDTSRAVSSGNATSAERACSRLGAATTGARAAPSIPDPAAQRLYARALDQFSQAAAECQAGASAKDMTMFTQVGTALRIANQDLATATAATPSHG